MATVLIDLPSNGAWVQVLAAGDKLAAISNNTQGSVYLAQSATLPEANSYVGHEFKPGFPFELQSSDSEGWYACAIQGRSGSLAVTEVS